MTDTLKHMIAGLKDLLLRFNTTKNSSEVGSLDSTGDGKLKNNAPDWTTIIIFVVFGIAMWLVPSPISNRIESIQTIPFPIYNTTVDTHYIPYPVYIGEDSATHVVNVTTPTMVELITEKDEPNAHIYIRTSAYPSLENDSLRLQMFHEYNIQPKCLEIIITDSIPYPVPVPVEVPFIEKPIVVATGTVAIVLGIVYIVGQALK